MMKMNNNIYRLFKGLLLACVVSVSSCKMQTLYDLSSGNVLIPVEFDWSDTNLESSDFSGASVWLFSTTASTTRSSSVIEYKLNDFTGGYIEVPPGEYNVLMFNKTVDEFEAIGNSGFRGTDSFTTFEYYKKEASATLYKDYGGEYSGRTYYKTPDRLASESRSLVVTQEMAEYNSAIVTARANRSSVMAASSKSLQTKYDDLYAGLPDVMLQLVNVAPVSIVNVKKVSAYVENGNNASGAEMLLSSSPTSIFLHDRSKSTSSGSVLFTFIDAPSYDEGDTTNATFEATMHHFGSVVSGSTSSRTGGVDSKVEFLFKLATNYTTLDQLYPVVGDGPFNKGVAAEDMDKIYNEVIIGKAAEGETSPIVLPELDAEEGGFNPGVGGWPDDDIIVPLG